MDEEALADARADLVATLEDTGYEVHAYSEPKVIGGSIVIDEAEPFIEYGEVLGSFAVNFNVLLFQDTKNMAAATKAMDLMVLLSVMNLGEWTLTNLESHIKVRLQENGPVFLMSRMSVTNLI